MDLLLDTINSCIKNLRIVACEQSSDTECALKALELSNNLAGTYRLLLKGQLVLSASELAKLTETLTEVSLGITSLRSPEELWNLVATKKLVEMVENLSEVPLEVPEKASLKACCLIL